MRRKHNFGITSIEGRKISTLNVKRWNHILESYTSSATNPQIFLLFMETTSFLYYFSEKIISIDKIPPILQTFKFVISCPTTEHGKIWVRPLLTSSKDIAQNTQATFDWVSSAVKTYLGYLSFIAEFGGRQAEPHTHHGKEKETHELIFSWLSWLAVSLVGAYARRRRRSCPTWRPYSK